MTDCFPSYKVPNSILRRRTWLTIAVVSGNWEEEASVGRFLYISWSGDGVDILADEITTSKRTARGVPIKRCVEAVSVVVKRSH